jgi:RNA polymerase sigma factor (TIGR02999 family)
LAAEITDLLAAWSQGDKQALEQLLPLVYDELRRVAARRLAHERPGHTLQPTALAHEAYLKLVGERGANWQGRAQFYGVAAEAMRRILVDHARARATAKRGAAQVMLSVDDVDVPGASGAAPIDLLALDAALERLAAVDPRLARIVELRHFGGLSVAETARVLHSSPATVKRNWALARAWLFRELGGGT